jgi:hypothetical protein
LPANHSVVTSVAAARLERRTARVELTDPDRPRWLRPVDGRHQIGAWIDQNTP